MACQRFYLTQKIHIRNFAMNLNLLNLCHNGFFYREGGKLIRPPPNSFAYF